MDISKVSLLTEEACVQLQDLGTDLLLRHSTQIHAVSRIHCRPTKANSAVSWGYCRQWPGSARLGVCCGVEGVSNKESYRAMSLSIEIALDKTLKRYQEVRHNILGHRFCFKRVQQTLYNPCICIISMSSSRISNSRVLTHSLQSAAVEIVELAVDSESDELLVVELLRDRSRFSPGVEVNQKNAICKRIDDKRLDR